MPISHKPMLSDVLQATRVSIIGFVGTLAGITLEQWSFVASILVSALTAIYMRSEERRVGKECRL